MMLCRSAKLARKENTRADMFSKLASGKEKGHLSSIIRQVLMRPMIECFNAGSTTRQRGWKEEIMKLIKEQEEGKNLRAEDAKKIVRYCMVGENLY